MLNDAESKQSAYNSGSILRKKMREKAKSSASSSQKSVLIASENMNSLKAFHEEEKTAVLKHAEEAENQLKPSPRS
jgi:hypothetical protein